MSHRLQFPDGLDAERFLSEFWQHRPLLMRDAFPGFRSPIAPDELAGLACEEGVESRIVLERGAHPWEVRHGPFDEETFAALPPSHWTLLVQDVDKHCPDAADLLDAFSFIPSWRLDDIMVSWAEDGGSVGPHTDEYDVFLIQAEGRRRWRIDPEPQPDAAFLPGLDLRIMDGFEAREQWVLEPGDLLYLPPSVPHWGIAEGPCMTWSVGLRSPDWREMATSWCDRVVAERLPRARWRDIDPRPPRHRGEIPPMVLSEIRGRIEDALAGADEIAFASWLGAFATEPKEHLEPIPREPRLGPAGFRLAFLESGAMERLASRMLFARIGDGLLLFAAGETYPLPADCLELAILLTERRVLDARSAAPWLERADSLAVLCTLYNRGHYELRER